MEIRREVYSSIIKIVFVLYTIIGGGIVDPFDYRFLLFRYVAINILLDVLYEKR